MAERRASASFHLVCSDEPRNGKTLYARLLADYLILCGRAPLIFDASHGADDLSGYYLVRSYKVDLSTALGQMALFDRALARDVQDCVVDLPAHILSRTAGLMRDIAFAEAGRGHGLSTVIHFLLDRRFESLFEKFNGRMLSAMCTPDLLGTQGTFALYTTRAESGQMESGNRFPLTLRDGKYADKIRKATDWFMERSQRNGLLGNPNNPTESARYMYGHGYGMLFLAQVYGQFDALALASDFTDMREARKLRESQA